MLIVALQDDIDDLYAIWNTVTSRFLGVNLNREEATKIIIDYKGYSLEEAISRLEHPQSFNDISRIIVENQYIPDAYIHNWRIDRGYE